MLGMEASHPLRETWPAPRGQGRALPGVFCRGAGKKLGVSQQWGNGLMSTLLTLHSIARPQAEVPMIAWSHLWAKSPKLSCGDQGKSGREDMSIRMRKGKGWCIWGGCEGSARADKDEGCLVKVRTCECFGDWLRGLQLTVSREGWMHEQEAM